MANDFEIAGGYLDIDADVSSALKDIRAFFKTVEKDLDQIEREFEESGRESGENLAEGATEGFVKGAPRFFRDVNGRLRDQSGRFAKAGEDAGEHYARGITDSIRRHLDDDRGIGGKGILSLLVPGGGGGGARIFSGLMSGASKFFSMFAKGFADAVTTGVDAAKNAWQTASQFFQQASNVAGGIGGILQFAGIAVIIPVILGLAGALLHLSAALLALPAAAGVAIAAILPLIIAFKGFGEAVGAGLSGDTEAFNEALKKLSPNAAQVAREFVKLAPILKDIKRTTQDAFFAPLVGVFTQLAPLLGVVRSGFAQIASAAGNIAAQLLRLLSTPEALATLNALFATTARIMQMLEPTTLNFVDGFLTLIPPALPFIERFVGLLQQGAAWFSMWADKAAKSGAMTSWLERAWNVGALLWDVLKGIGEYVFIILNALGDEGTDTLKGIGEALKEALDYLKSSEGAETLHNLGVMVHWAGNAFVFLLGHTVTAWRYLNMFFDAVRAVRGWLGDVGGWFADAGSAIAGWASSAWSAVTGFFSSIWSSIKGFFSEVGDGASAAGNWFSELWSTILDGGKAALDWVIALPGRIATFFTELPGMIWDAVMRVYDAIFFMIGFLGGLLVGFWTQTFPNMIKDGWNWAYSYVVEGAQRTWERIAAFPGQVWSAIQAVQTFVGDALRQAWDWAYRYTVEGIEKSIARARAFPGQAWDALSSLGSTLWRLFTEAWNRVNSAVSQGITSTINWLQGLPGRARAILSSAGDWLYDTGRDMLRGLVNGLEDTLSWAVDMARRAANKIKEGFLNALEIFSPSRVMAREVGRPIIQGIGVGMQREMPNLDRYVTDVSLGLARAGGDGASMGTAPVVSVGSPQVAVMLDGEEISAKIMLRPARVAAATDEGRRQRSWVYSPRAKS